MNNAKTTKRALLSSVIATFLCFAMLLGTTFAWFTDSATSAGNKIVAGELKVKLNMWTSASDCVEITDSSAPIFGDETSLIAQNNAANTLWEPGKTQVVYLSIENAGTLDLKYKVNLNVTNPLDGKDLYKALQYDIIPDATYGTVSSWANEGSDVVEGFNSTEANNVTLKKGEQHYFALAVHMKEDAGNEYMNGKVLFDIAVLAAQLASESDSFDNSYDSLAPYGSGAFLVSATTVEATANVGESVTTANEDNTFKATATAGSTGKVTATIAPTSATESVMAVVGQAGQSLVSYDINVTGHKDGTPVTVEVFVGKNLVDVEVYHKGALMTSGVSYSATTGIVTIVTNDFSPFEIAYYPAGNVPLAKVTKIESQKVSSTIGMGGAASEFNLDVGYLFSMTQTAEEAAASRYANYHADFVVSVNGDVAPEAVALLGYYAAYCDDYNDGNWVAMMSDETIPAKTEIRLIQLLLNGGSINYSELGEWVKDFKCGASKLDDSANGITLTVELRLYETLPYDHEAHDDCSGRSQNCETGEYLSICTYAYTFK